MKKKTLRPLSLALALSVPSVAQAIDEVPEALRYVERDDAILNTIAEQLPERRAVNAGFLSDDTSPVLSLNQDAKVWVTGWDEGAGYRNSIMVVQYEDGAFDGLTKGDIDTNGRGTISMNELNRVDGVQADWLFPNFSMQGKGGQLLPGATLDLNEGAPIAAGTNITFGLAANAWRGNSINGQNIGGNGSNYWGLDFLNPEASASADINSREDNSRHVAMLFADDSQNTVLMGFEDLRRPWGDNDFNDAVFSIYATPEGAFAGSEIATAPAPGLAVLGLLGLAFLPRVRKKA